MAFSETDRVNIRNYLGYAALWLQADPRLESAISNIQAVSSVDPSAVGGTRPDRSSESAVRYMISQLIGVDASLDNLDNQQGATAVDETRLDSIREDARLRRKGRMYVFRLAKILDTEPRADVFNSSSNYGGTSPGGGFRAGGGFIGGPTNGRTAY